MNQNETMKQPQVGQSELTDGLGGRLLGWWESDSDAGNAWLMTTALFITLAGAIFSHGNWMAVWFAFSGAWFAWRVVVVKKMTLNVELTCPQQRKGNYED